MEPPLEQPSPRGGLGLLCQALDLIHSLRQDLPKRHALALAHRNEVQKRLVERRRGGGLRGVVLCLVALRLDDLDHTLDRQEPIDTWRYRIDLAGQHAGNPHDRRQHLFIDTDGRDRVGVLDVQIGVHCTPR